MIFKNIYKPKNIMTTKMTTSIIKQIMIAFVVSIILADKIYIVINKNVLHRKIQKLLQK